MENKLKQLTQKLYDEGLAQGRAEADKVLKAAHAEAKKLVDDAKAEAKKLVDDAKQHAADVARNTQTEVAQAARQAVAMLKEQIASMVITKATADGVKAASVEPELVKELILTAVKEDKNMTVKLPSAMEKSFEASAKALMSKGIEVGYSDTVKTGFRLAPKDGGYYISFSDSDFEGLLRTVLREKMYQMLYK